MCYPLGTNTAPFSRLAMHLKMTHNTRGPRCAGGDRPTEDVVMDVWVLAGCKRAPPTAPQILLILLRGTFSAIAGTLNPALAPLAHRACAGLAIAAGVTGVAYTLPYLRTIRQIVEPDIVPGARAAARGCPILGGLSQPRQCSQLRALLLSRQHRMMLAFYFGIASPWRS